MQVLYRGQYLRLCVCVEPGESRHLHIASPLGTISVAGPSRYLSPPAWSAPVFQALVDEVRGIIPGHFLSSAQRYALDELDHLKVWETLLSLEALPWETDVRAAWSRVGDGAATTLAYESTTVPGMLVPVYCDFIRRNPTGYTGDVLNPGSPMADRYAREPVQIIPLEEVPG